MEHPNHGDGRRGGTVSSLLQAAAPGAEIVAVQRLHVGGRPDTVCHDKCPRYAMHRALIWAGKPSKGERAAAEVTLEGKLRSIRHRGTGKVAQR